MRIRLICTHCYEQARDLWFVDTIRDDGLYVGKCPAGHDLLLATQTLRHEMLFEIALNAIEDKYYREAVSSFAASVERFYEFAVRVMCYNRGIPQSPFDQAWQRIAKQSERQLGAYVFLYFSEFGEIPELLSNSMTEFRNGVIHQGLLPQRDDVLRFGNAAYEVIQRGVRQLRETHLEYVTRALVEHMETRFRRANGTVTVLTTPTALNIILDISGGYLTFDQILNEHLNPSSR